MHMQRRHDYPAYPTAPLADRRMRQPEGARDLLPWADPYIVGLIQEHERQLRGARAGDHEGVRR